MDQYVPWITAAIGTIVGTLASAVLILWRMDESRDTVIIEKLEKAILACEADRKLLRTQISELTTRIAILENVRTNDERG